MTPAQKRQVFPMRPTTPAEKLINSANSCITSVWPLSAMHSAMVEYCTTISTRLDPHRCGEPLVDARR